ncbi:hypothetical protein VPHF99_0191 [Vibrio phage F99]|nr:hypothetical protein MYOV085v1_p0218 [Vibrio phage 355E48.1]
MTELKREDFIDTWFDVSKWTEKQKVKFQLKCFELGYRWIGHEERPQELDGARYFLIRSCITYSTTQYDSNEHKVEKFYEDMFPDYEAPKPINVVGEITQLFSEEMDKEDSDEDERSFEGLVINSNVVESEQHWVIFLKDLSNEQLQWMESVFTTDSRYIPTQGSQDVVMGNLRGEDAMSMWSNYSKDFLPSITCTVITFNQLFKYEDEL